MFVEDDNIFVKIRPEVYQLNRHETYHYAPDFVTVLKNWFKLSFGLALGFVYSSTQCIKPPLQSGGRLPIVLPILIFLHYK